MPTSHAVKNIVLAVLILLPARAVAATAQKAKDCPLQMQASLEFRTLPEGRISIPVKIQGQELFFMIDTGGVVSTLDPVIAARMNLQPNPTPAPLFGVGGVWLNQMVHAQDLAFSRFILDRPVFYLQPPSWRDLSGTMASELLRLFDVDFDFAGGKFNLFSPDHCPGKVVYWTREPVAIVSMLRASQGGHIRIPITVDGKDMTATVDTGATSSVMSLHAAIRYLDIDEKDPQLKTVGSGANLTYRYPFKSVGFHDVSVNNPFIVILQDKDMQKMGTDMILGMNTLRQFHMYVAYDERKLYFSAANAH